MSYNGKKRRRAVMRKTSCFLIGLLVALAAGVHAQSFAFDTGDASFDLTLNSLNAEAKLDIGGFVASVSVDFGTPKADVQALITTEKMEPAEAYLVFEMAALLKKPPSAVVVAYKSNKGKGWGTVAKSLGIKPGSAEFKALKDKASAKSAKQKAKGKGKSKS
jgi:hypothetical protein